MIIKQILYTVAYMYEQIHQAGLQTWLRSEEQVCWTIAALYLYYYGI